MIIKGDDVWLTPELPEEKAKNVVKFIKNAWFPYCFLVKQTTEFHHQLPFFNDMIKQEPRI